MDKSEYQSILDQIQTSVNKKDYQKAYSLAKTIDWRRVKSFKTLNMVADIYEINRDYEECKNILLMAKSRASVGKGILYRLVEVCIKLDQIDEAEGYFNEYERVAANDSGVLLLKYMLAKAKNSPIEEQIDYLEEYKSRDYTEKWVYELALLYSKAGNKRKAVDTCDDMILWFQEGKYVLRAMELKQKYVPLTPSQQEYFDKEQRDSDPRLFMPDKNFAAGIMAKGASAKAPSIGVDPEQLIKEDMEKREKKENLSIMDRMEAAGAKAAKDVNVDKTTILQLSPEEIDKFAVTSPEFMGGKPDLHSELGSILKEEEKEEPAASAAPEEPAVMAEEETAKEEPEKEEMPEASEEEVSESEEETKEEAPEGTVAAETAHERVHRIRKPLPARNWVCPSCGEENIGKFCVECGLPKPEHTALREADPNSWTCPVCGEVNIGKFCVECGLKKPEEAAAEEAKEEDAFAPKKDAPAPTFPSDWEIPDPEETEEEKKTHTIPLGKIGQNTVPISVEEIIRNETPEERRIRILNNASPTRMNDEQRQIFTYFARIPGMDAQILEAVTGVYKFAGEHTSKRGNIAVMGAAGMGKTRLTYGLIVMMAKDMGLEAVKIARLSGEQMNEADPAEIVAKMSGGFLSIEHASDMTAETVDKLSKAMEFKTDCMILIIEDEKNAIRAMFGRYPEFAEKFTGSISIPAFTNDELVAFARAYCAENNCELDEMGVLALYTLISNNQTEEQPVSISSIKEMVDAAISHAKRTGRKVRKGVKGKQITLYEKDFII